MAIRTVLFVWVTSLFTVPGGLAADSQLAPYFQRMLEAHAEPAKYDSIAATEPDLFKAVPSEEIPAIIEAVNSGNPILMRAGVLSATTILTIHKVDGENPNFRRLKPQLPQVIQDFQLLVPVLVTHFGDLTAPTSVTVNGETDSTEIGWKTHVVQFMDVMRASPSPEMLVWMLKVVQWPKGRMDALDKIESAYARRGLKKLSDGERASLGQTIAVTARATALNVIPTLAH
jgi:hypothetical protein